MNGKLLYKRWLNTGQSIVFHAIPHRKYVTKLI
jgi:hypothetical protein